MSERPRRATAVKDYNQLVKGMSTHGNKGEGSVKSGRSGRSKKSTKGQANATVGEEIQQLDDKLTEIQKQIDSDPAYLTILDESIRKKFGEEYMTEAPIPPDLSDDKMFEELRKTHEEELVLMEKREIQLARRQELINYRDKLAMKRAQVEARVEEQKLQEREVAMKCAKRMLEVEKKKAEIAKQEETLRKEGKLYYKPDEAKSEVPPEDSALRTERWVLQGAVGGIVEPNEVEMESKKRKPTTSIAPSEGQISLTGSQVVIRDLKKQLEQTQRQLQVQTQQVKEDHLTRIPGGIDRLKQMGLVSQQAAEELVPPQQLLPTEKEKKKLCENEDDYLANTGKDNLIDSTGGAITCTNCVMEKSKIKSGKYVKSNIHLKVQEQWPHLNVMRKYTKRTTFESKDFETLVAGETKIILEMRDKQASRGRMDLLCKLAHWLCRCKDWGAVKGLYEAILESIELGEENWYSDFSHYEMMLPPVKIERTETPQRHHKSDIYWYKPFQKGICTERHPHMAQLKADEPPVPVQHICAACLQRDGGRSEHAEVECPVKRDK